MARDFKPSGTLVGACGRYCGSCYSLVHGKCPGCGCNAKATWCGIRNCCLDEEIDNCACCKKFSNPQDCPRFNNIILTITDICLNQDRVACIRRIKEIGRDAFAREMHEKQKRCLPRR